MPLMSSLSSNWIDSCKLMHLPRSSKFSLPKFKH